ncbi:hypothetical protein ACLOJK_023900, partial [Asimina triloba]
MKVDYKDRRLAPLQLGLCGKKKGDRKVGCARGLCEQVRERLDDDPSASFYRGK